MGIKKKQVTVIGLGYVGLPLALLFAKKGYDVIGIDTDDEKVTSLQNAISYIPDVSTSELTTTTTFQAVVPYKGIGALKESEYIIVTVPTPIINEDEPDLRALIAASHYIKKHLQPGQTVIYESSTYPGTLEEVVMPILAQGRFTVGVDFHLSYSPERIDPANKQFNIEVIPKVVSGQTVHCLEKVVHFYGSVFQKVVPVSSPKIAEMCKLFENIQRLVNISLVNETSILCKKMNIDFYEVLKAAETKPFGFTAYWPGPGIGGHCIPVDPIYFLWKLKQHGLTSELIEVAHSINKQMPHEIVDEVKAKIIKGKVLVIGLTYKKDVNDIRESPAIEICEQLIHEGYFLTYHDPLVNYAKLNNKTYHSVDLTEEVIKQHDLVLILTDHTSVDWDLVKLSPVTIDPRNVLKQ
ncbi:nucleotide sugar dehydrogenase [Bacillus sp. CGMCC 1.16541]|uniref:nucleotide sugar dehydrogenase n=1 Tax=Bacillus sp. CGMCC 1.16541 TaxID=2185143 RepID=UPI000D73AFBC|nr:nucleotide sugar dehydrogenase [Bacillus sp. CGMCC 1.16541]